MLRLRALVVLALFYTLSVSLFAQAPGTGLYAFGSFDNRGFDSINIGNLNTHFEIPIVNKSGRGVPFKYSIVYDGLIWSPAGVSGSEYWVPDSAWGFHGQVNGGQLNDGFIGHLNYHTQNIKCYTDPTDWYWTTRTSNYWYYDAVGQQHYFNYATDDCQATTTGDGSTSDGSGYRYDGANVRTSTGSVMLVPENTTAGSSTYTDTNGNTINNNGAGTFTDTLGVNALVVTGAGNASDPHVFTYKVANQSDSSTMAAVTMSYHTYSVQTSFGCKDSSGTAIAEYGPLQFDLVDRITLADGTHYQFTYEPTPGVSGTVTGRLASITLPTGGTISYQYSGGCNGNGLNADGTIGNLTRTTTDGTKTYTRTYTRSQVNSNATNTTLQDETTPANQSLYQFTIANGLFYETHRQVYQGSISGTPLLDQQTCYNGSITGCDGSSITPPVTETYVTAMQNGGEQSQTVNYYDSSSGLLTSTSSEDGGSLLEGTSYTYNSVGGVSSITVTDGTQTVSQTTYGYDEGQPPTPTSNIPQHNAVSGTRGNQTSSHAWITSTTSIDTTTTYYDTGVPISTMGPTGTTQYSYEPTTQGFLTKATPPTPSSGVSLPSYASYDVNSGIQLSASDANNGPSTPQVQYAQYDKLLRPTRVNTIDGGNTTYTYGTYQGSQMLQIGNAIAGNTAILYDPYGRVSRVTVYNGNNQASSDWYQVDYCYGPTGTLQFQSAGYQGPGFSAAKQCSGSGTTYTYDALGRVTNISNADGNTTYQYNKRAVLVKDVNGVQKITQTDALGRISAICEISSNSLQRDSPQPCGLNDIPGSWSGSGTWTGYLTNYAYDLFNHKTTITQGAQTRIFQTDSLGRPTFVQEPESGQTTYSYSYNSTGLQVTRTRPRANQTDPNCVTQNIAQYDSIGRVISISYTSPPCNNPNTPPDPTPAKSFSYDQATAWGNTTYSLGASKGQLTAVIANPAGSWTGGGFFGYDSMGRVTTMAECLPSGCGNGALDKYLSYTYDLAGNMISSSDGAGVTTSYGYSPASEITSITSSVANATNPSSLVSNVQNGPFGPLTWTLGNGLTGYQDYDWAGRRFETRVCAGAPSLSCSPQPYGLNVYRTGTTVSQVQDTVANASTYYNYDEFGRLSHSTVNSWVQLPQQNFGYNYDRYGNRWQQNAPQGGPAPQYSFNKSTNQIVGSGVTYDAAGNVINDGFHSYTYDAEGNITQVDGGATAKYEYNALNQRVRVDVGSTSAEYVYNLSGQRVSVWNGNNHQQYLGQYYWGSQPIAFYGAGSLHFQHQDWLGTERVRTSYNGGTEGTFGSLPFGDGFTVSGADNDPYHFAQLDHDSESNTEHAQFRNYSSTSGRWLSPDPYNGSYDFGDPQSLNRYPYVLNNPLGLIDPLGLKDCSHGEPNCHPPLPPPPAWTPINFCGLWGCDNPGNGPRGGGNGGGKPAPKNTPKETIQQASARCSAVADAVGAKSFSSAGMTLDQVAITAISLAVNILGRGQAVKAAANSAAISQTIKSGYFLTKGIFQSNEAYNQCMNPGSDPSMAMY